MPNRSATRDPSSTVATASVVPPAAEQRLGEVDVGPSEVVGVPHLEGDRPRGLELQPGVLADRPVDTRSRPSVFRAWPSASRAPTSRAIWTAGGRPPGTRPSGRAA